MTVDVYSQYFGAACVYHEVPRRAAIVNLTCESGGGEVRYTAFVSFFPHTQDDDFAISYDACAEKVLLARNGRRSKKREAELLEGLRAHVDELAAGLGGQGFWERPLREARLG